MAIEIGGAKPAILVTGGAGYIGSHAVLELLDAGYPTVVIDNLVTGFRWAVDPRAVFVQGAIEDDALVRRTVREHAIGGVLHFAGSTVAPESVADPLKYYRNNTAASRSLLESVIGEGVRHFVFSSTAAVYGVELLDAHDASGDAVAAGQIALALARKFPDQVDIELERLHAQQVEWAEQSAASFEDYMRRERDPQFTAERGWPARPL